jgi:hypothetical protein
MSKTPRIPRSLGKSWVTLDDPFVFPMTLLTLDVDRIMVRFMELAMRKGYLTRPLSVVTESTYENLFLEELVNDPRISGLSDEERREVLNGWIRATLIELERSGAGRDKERRIAYIKPVTLGVIRSGLPRGTYMIRHADIWAYRMCLEELRQRGISNVRAQLRETVHQSLGEGIDVSLQNFQSGEPTYDEQTDIDITALLAMRLLSRFTDARPSDEVDAKKPQEIWPVNTWNELVRKDSKHISGLTPKEPKDLKLIGPEPFSNVEQLVALPNAFLPLGRDLFDLLSNYGKSLSHSELTQHCIGLMALRLFQAPLRVAKGLQTIEFDDVPSRSSNEDNSLEMYCDFTNGSLTGSVELSKLCVRRDIELHHDLLESRLRLRVLSWIGDLTDATTRKRLLELRQTSIAHYYKELLDLRHTEKFEQTGLLKLQQFQASLDSENEETSGNWRQLIRDWESAGLKSFDILLEILKSAYSPGSRAPAQHFQWFWTSGGLLNSPPHRPYALLGGSVKHKSTWRYEPSDTLLMSILMACFVEGSGEHQWVTPELRLTEVIQRIEARFGILIDRPPRNLVNADNQRIAALNKQAFVKKLQLFGCFEGLSDDPEYQLVNRPRKANNGS